MVPAIAQSSAQVIASVALCGMSTGWNPAPACPLPWSFFEYFLLFYLAPAFATLPQV